MCVCWGGGGRELGWHYSGIITEMRGGGGEKGQIVMTQKSSEPDPKKPRKLEKHFFISLCIKINIDKI